MEAELEFAGEGKPMARKNEARKKDGTEKRERERQVDRGDQPMPSWEPIPLHIPVPERPHDRRMPKGDEPGRGVVIIDFGG